MITHVIQHVVYKGTFAVASSLSLLILIDLDILGISKYFQVFEPNILTVAFHFLNYEDYGGKGPLLIK